MAINPHANAAMGGLAGLAQQQAHTHTTTAGLAQLSGAGQYAGTTTYAVPYQQLIAPGWPTPPDPFPFPNPHAMNFIGHFRIRTVENGYLIEYQLREGEAAREYYAADLKEAGERITALCVEKALKGEPK